jgi:hypothetical protein
MQLVLLSGAATDMGARLASAAGDTFPSARGKRVNTTRGRTGETGFPP